MTQMIRVTGLKDAIRAVIIVGCTFKEKLSQFDKEMQQCIMRALVPIRSKNSGLD